MFHTLPCGGNHIKKKLLLIHPVLGSDSPAGQHIADGRFVPHLVLTHGVNARVDLHVKDSRVSPPVWRKTTHLYLRNITPRECSTDLIHTAHGTSHGATGSSEVRVLVRAGEALFCRSGFHSPSMLRPVLPFRFLEHIVQAAPKSLENTKNLL